MKRGASLWCPRDCMSGHALAPGRPAAFSAPPSFVAAFPQGSVSPTTPSWAREEGLEGVPAWKELSPEFQGSQRTC